MTLVHSVSMLYWLSQTLFSAVRLGVFERLALGPQTAGQVAWALGLSPDATERLLLALAAMEFVQQQGEVFTNAPVSAMCLVSGSPWYIGGIAHHHADLLWPLWNHLPTAVREGRPVLREAFGGGRNPFDLLIQSPEDLLKFLSGMDAGAYGMGEAISLAHDFAQHGHMLDVGGGAGTVAGPIVQRFPHLRATVFELPAVCAFLPAILPRYGCGKRLTAHPGDFFRPETFPVGCDAALLCRVLHDWSDEHALAILHNTHAALAPGGTVLIAETVLDTPDPGGRLFATLSNLMMLLLTDGGRERTAAEYAALLQAAGFAVLGTVQTGGGLVLVKGRKP